MPPAENAVRQHAQTQLNGPKVGENPAGQGKNIESHVFGFNGDTSNLMYRKKIYVALSP